MSIPPPRPPAERFAIIMDSVAKALAAQGLRGALMGPLLILVWNKLSSTGARILRLAARLQAGTLRLHPPRTLPPLPPHRDAAQKNAPPPAPGKPEKPKIPQVFGWLPRLVREVNFGQSQLTHLLNQPDMVDLIAAAPPIAHHLRPICRMLGVKPPPGLFPPRRGPRRRDATPAPAPAEKPAPAKKTPSGPFPPIVARKRRRRPAPFRPFPLPAGAGPPWKD